AALVEALLGDREAALRVGAGHAEAVRQQRAEVARGGGAEHEHDEPRPDDALAVMDYPVGPAKHRRAILILDPRHASCRRVILLTSSAGSDPARQCTSARGVSALTAG